MPNFLRFVYKLLRGKVRKQLSSQNKRTRIRKLIQALLLKFHRTSSSSNNDNNAILTFFFNCLTFKFQIRGKMNQSSVCHPLPPSPVYTLNLRTLEKALLLRLSGGFLRANAPCLIFRWWHRIRLTQTSLVICPHHRVQQLLLWWICGWNSMKFWN